MLLIPSLKRKVIHKTHTHTHIQCREKKLLTFLLKKFNQRLDLCINEDHHFQDIYIGFRNLNPIKSSVQQAGGNRHPSPDSNFFPLVLNPRTSAWADVTLRLNLLSGSYKPLTVLEPEKLPLKPNL